MADVDRLRSDLGDGPAPAKYALSAVVYAERGDDSIAIDLRTGGGKMGKAGKAGR